MLRGISAYVRVVVLGVVMCPCVQVGGTGRVGSSTAAALVASGADVQIFLAGRNRHVPPLLHPVTLDG